MWKPIEVWHVCISGYRQHHGRPNGLQLLWQRLRSRHHNGGVSVELRDWNSDWDALAEFIWNFRPLSAPPRILVYAYSWGAGWGFIRLARALKERGLTIDAAVLSDPVYRSPWRLLAWLAVSPLRVIRVPDNVRQVHYFFQRQDWPRGHRVRAIDPQRTTIVDCGQIDAAHAYMDDAREFHDLALNATHTNGPHDAGA